MHPKSTIKFYLLMSTNKIISNDGNHTATDLYFVLFIEELISERHEGFSSWGNLNERYTSVVSHLSFKVILSLR